MRILLIGKNGQLGRELAQMLATLGPLQAVDLPEVDLAKPETVRPLMRQGRPEIVVNAAAYTAVDRAETEADLALRINGLAPGWLAEEARRLGAALVHYSTDYVFDGEKKSPYSEDDPPRPLNTYGRTKLQGERAVQAMSEAYLILRTSWLYSLHGPGFVGKVMNWARSQQELRVVEDEVSSPTWARALARATVQILAQADPGILAWMNVRRGVYHLAGAGAASRLEWAREILRCDPRPQEHRVHEIQSARRSDFPSLAERPAYSVLDCRRVEEAFGVRLPPWRQALRQALSESP